MARKLDTENEKKKRRLVCIKKGESSDTNESLFECLDDNSTFPGVAVGFTPEIGVEFLGEVSQTGFTCHITKWHEQFVAPSLYLITKGGVIDSFVNHSVKPSVGNPGDCVLAYKDGEVVNLYTNGVISGIEVKRTAVYTRPGHESVYELTTVIDDEEYTIKYDEKFNDIVQEAKLFDLLVDVTIDSTFSSTPTCSIVSRHPDIDRLIAAQYKLTTGRVGQGKTFMLSALLEFLSEEANKLL